MRKWLLFTNGGGSSDPLNWVSSEAALYSSDDLKTIKPGGSNSVDLFFETNSGNQKVTLKIKNRAHIKVISAIANAIEKSSQSIISIADKDSNRFVSSFIYDVIIRSKETYIQSLTSSSRTRLTVNRGDIDYCIIANTHSSAVTCGLELYDGTTYTYLVRGLSIPKATSLTLNSKEIAFDDVDYTLYGTSNNGSGLLTFTFNY